VSSERAPDVSPFFAVDGVFQTLLHVLDDFGAPLRSDGRRGGHVFNLGHGISQHTPPEHVQALVEAVHAQSRQTLQQKTLKA
jgi:uroporphyrinogen decarboxylase